MKHLSVSDMQFRIWTPPSVFYFTMAKIKKIRLLETKFVSLLYFSFILIVRAPLRYFLALPDSVVSASSVLVSATTEDFSFSCLTCICEPCV